MPDAPHDQHNLGPAGPPGVAVWAHNTRDVAVDRSWSPGLSRGIRCQSSGLVVPGGPILPPWVGWGGPEDRPCQPVEKVVPARRERLAGRRNAAGWHRVQGSTDESVVITFFNGLLWRHGQRADIDSDYRRRSEETGRTLVTFDVRRIDPHEMR